MRTRVYAFFAVPLLFCASIVLAKVGGGDIRLNVKGMSGVTFSHENHVARAGLQCTECHDRLYVTNEKHKNVTMAEIQKGRSCGACHNGKKAFDVKGNCNSCHK